MYIIVLPRAIVVDGETVTRVGMFPSEASCQAWADAYEAAHEGVSLDGADVEAVHIVDKHDRLPVSNVVLLRPDEPGLDPVRAVLDPLPVKPAPMGKARDPIHRDRDGRIVQRLFTDDQCERAVAARSGLCLACGEMVAGVEPHYQWGSCPHCSNVYVWGTSALLAGGRIHASSKRK